MLANAIAMSLLSQDGKANRHWVVQIKRPNKQTSQINCALQSMLEKNFGGMQSVVDIISVYKFIFLEAVIKEFWVLISHK